MATELSLNLSRPCSTCDRSEPPGPSNPTCFRCSSTVEPQIAADQSGEFPRGPGRARFVFPPRAQPEATLTPSIPAVHFSPSLSFSSHIFQRHSSLSGTKHAMPLAQDLFLDEICEREERKKGRSI